MDSETLESKETSEAELSDQNADCIDPVTLLTAPSPQSPAGDTLEVYQIWGDSILDGRAYRPSAPPVRIGPGFAPHWNFLGIDMGQLSRPLGTLLSMAPLWSEVRWDQRHEFQLPGDAQDGESGWELFRHDGQGFVAQIPVGPGWTGQVLAEGQWRPLSERGTPRILPDGEEILEVRLDGIERMVLEHEGFVFVAARAQTPRRVEVRGLGGLEPTLMGALGLGAVLFLALTLLARLQDPSPIVEAIEDPERVVELRPELPSPTARTASASQGGSSSPREAQPSRAAQPRSDEQVAKSAGLLKAFEDEAISRMLGGPGLSAALSQGVSQLIGATGTTIGGNGLAGGGFGGGCLRRGDCGGNAEGLGWDRGHGPGWGADNPGGPGGVKTEGEVDFTQPPLVVGSLNKKEIDEIIKQHEAAVRYCYQRELQKDPSLGGKVVLKFTISRDGSVSSAAAASSSLGSKAVEQCLVGRFLRMRFPEPRGGGVVIVSYPLMFSAR